MARPLRIEFDGAWHHVMNRGRRRENIFRDQEDYSTFVGVLKSTSEMFRVGVTAYCLMPNHFHLLLHTPEANLGRAMRHLGGVYTQLFNRRHGLDGQLFRGRYKAILVDESEYLQGLARYIHHNPLKAGLVNKLEDYPWSSHHGYLARNKTWEWLHTTPLLSEFSGDTAKARAGYRRFMALENDEDIERIFSLKKLPAILGSLEFIQTMKERFFAAKVSMEVPEAKMLSPISIESIKVVVSAYYGVKEADLYVVRRGVTNEPRNVAVYLARTLRGESLQEIAKQFQIKTYSTAGSVVGCVKARLQEDGAFARRLARIREMLEIGYRKT